MSASRALATALATTTTTATTARTVSGLVGLLRLACSVSGSVDLGSSSVSTAAPRCARRSSPLRRTRSSVVDLLVARPCSPRPRPRPRRPRRRRRGCVVAVLVGLARRADPRSARCRPRGPRPRLVSSAAGAVTSVTGVDGSTVVTSMGRPSGAAASRRAGVDAGRRSAVGLQEQRGLRARRRVSAAAGTCACGWSTVVNRSAAGPGAAAGCDARASRRPEPRRRAPRPGRLGLRGLGPGARRARLGLGRVRPRAPRRPGPRPPGPRAAASVDGAAASAVQRRVNPLGDVAIDAGLRAAQLGAELGEPRQAPACWSRPSNFARACTRILSGKVGCRAAAAEVCDFGRRLIGHVSLLGPPGASTRLSGCDAATRGRCYVYRTRCEREIVWSRSARSRQ